MAHVTLDGSVSVMMESQSIYIPVEAQHRIENAGCIVIFLSMCWSIPMPGRMILSVVKIAMRGQDHSHRV
ncbi:hypothetical protein [Sphingobium fuliginis]